MLLKSNECSPEAINFLANKACQCYVALCDWASVKEWQATINALKHNSTSPVNINLRTDFNYIQALSCFEDGDLAGCEAQLELLPGEDYSCLSSTKDKLGKYQSHPKHFRSKNWVVCMINIFSIQSERERKKI